MIATGKGYEPNAQKALAKERNVKRTLKSMGNSNRQLAMGNLETSNGKTNVPLPIVYCVLPIG
jgi:hypothetical protein